MIRGGRGRGQFLLYAMQCLTGSLCKGDGVQYRVTVPFTTAQENSNSHVPSLEKKMPAIDETAQVTVRLRVIGFVVYGHQVRR